MSSRAADGRVDVLVVGGGLGGVAAALAAADAGAVVVLTAEEPVIGGQVTAQAVSPLDEHPLIETTGAPASYQEFRRRVRAHYGGLVNPGGGWVSRLCFEPEVGRVVLEGMLAEHVAAGRLRVETSRRPVAARTDPATGDVVAVELAGPGGRTDVHRAAVVVDATELGDLLVLAGTDTVIGSEGQDLFGEPHAVPGGPDPAAEQSCTWVAALRLEDHPTTPVSAPVDHQRLAAEQPFGLDLAGWDGTVHRYGMFRDGPDGRPPFWTYRRVRDAAQLGGRDAIVLNWAGNDYAGSGLVADPARTHRGARDLTLAFVHWLQTEAPRDDGGRGHPEIALAPDVTGTDDGLALAPYVRESRRLASAHPVTEHDLVAAGGAEHARVVADAVGTAWYHADLHPRIGYPDSVYAPTAPFHVPAGALVAEPGRGPANLLAGAKNLAATQVAAAAYRVHPGEWSVGEAAGVAAALAVATGRRPADLLRSPGGVRDVQLALLRRGTPLVWARDLPTTHPGATAATLAVLAGAVVGPRATSLDLRPDEPATGPELAALAEAFGLSHLPEGDTWAEATAAAVALAGGPRRAGQTATGTSPHLLPDESADLLPDPPTDLPARRRGTDLPADRRLERA
nr:FAD-dependent oxidoreductase [uncultured Actinotalea sp.]